MREPGKSSNTETVIFNPLVGNRIGTGLAEERKGRVIPGQHEHRLQ